MLEWQPWLECQTSRPLLGHVCALAETHLQASSSVPEASEASLDWRTARVLVQRLYNKVSRVRQVAAKRLMLAGVGQQGLLEDPTIEGVPNYGIVH